MSPLEGHAGHSSDRYIPSEEAEDLLAVSDAVYQVPLGQPQSLLLRVHPSQCAPPVCLSKYAPPSVHVWAVCSQPEGGLGLRVGRGMDGMASLHHDSSGSRLQRGRKLILPFTRMRSGALANLVLFCLRFEVVGYGCSTCVGNTGPLSEAVLSAVRQVTAR